MKRYKVSVISMLKNIVEESLGSEATTYEISELLTGIILKSSTSLVNHGGITIMERYKVGVISMLKNLLNRCSGLYICCHLIEDLRATRQPN